MQEFIEPFLSAQGLVSLVTLFFLELVLGIDNIIFIAILCGYLPTKDQQKRARFIGLMMAMVVRIILLLTISWIAQLVHPLFMIGDFGVSGRDIILFSGGVFLVIKTISELYHKFKIADHEEAAKSRQMTMTQAIIQITLIDIVFSFDSIITAVGLSNEIPIMVVAVVLSMIAMLMFAPYVSDFISKYPTIKILALVFLILIGAILIIEGLHMHFDKTYAYVAMAFALVVEIVNIRLRNVHLKRGRPDGH
jgi:predicted tellurium resistance membrane protein TerC